MCLVQCLSLNKFVHVVRKRTEIYFKSRDSFVFTLRGVDLVFDCLGPIAETVT